MSKQERRRNGTFRKGTHWRKPKPHWSKRWLKREYVTKQRSAADIAQECGCKENNILYWLHKHAIPRRSMKEVRAVKRWTLSGEANGMYGRRGPKAPQWRGGATPERQAAYAKSEWAKLCKEVRKRDAQRCVRCGAAHSRDNKLHIHHVATWSDYPGKRFVASNLVSLCRKCHLWVHSRKNTKREYLSP